MPVPIAERLNESGSTIELAFAYDPPTIAEVKAMEGARWNPEIKRWTVKNTVRNRWALSYLKGVPVYAPFLTQAPDIDMPQLYNHIRGEVAQFRKHQVQCIRDIVAKKRQVLAFEPGTGKTLCALGSIYLAKKVNVWYVAPKGVIPAVKLDLRKWRFDGQRVSVQLLSYEDMVKVVATWAGGEAPEFVVFDEAHWLKNPDAARTKAAMHLVNSMRMDHAEPYVLLMTGTPMPKDPVDWWQLCELAQPGYLREGDRFKFRKRLAVVKDMDAPSGGKFPKVICWRDGNKDRCNICGTHKDDHFLEEVPTLATAHAFVPMVDEIGLLPKRMRGLVSVGLKKDLLDLPEKIYREIILPPSAATQMLAETVVRAAPRAITALIMARTISDGFIYRKAQGEPEVCRECNGAGCDVCDGTGIVTPEFRDIVQVETPKRQALLNLMDECVESGRIVIFAGFTASIDRCVKIVSEAKWDYIAVDGRGWRSSLGTLDPVELLQRFDDKRSTEKPLAFIAHPKSGGQGLTLTASHMAVFWSNDFDGAGRIQAEDRVHRVGTTRAVQIVDLIHLPSDKYVLDNLKQKRDLQAITLGDITHAISRANFDANAFETYPS